MSDLLRPLRSLAPDIPSPRSYRALAAAGAISEFGDWSARLALAAYLFEATGDPAWVGMVAVVFMVPRLGLGQLLTGWSERRNRKTVLIMADSLRAAVFVAAGLIDLSPTGMLVLVLVAATADPVFEANASAAAFDELTDRDRDAGVRFRQTSRMAAQIAGLGATGIALGLVAPKILLLANAASFAASALIVSRVPVARCADAVDGATRVLMSAARMVIAQPHIRAALATTCIVACTTSSVEAQVVSITADLPGWALPAASAVAPLTALFAVASTRTRGGTKATLRRSMTTTSGCAVLAIVALSFAQAIAVVVAFAAVGAMVQTTVAGQIVAVRHLPDVGRASTLSLLQTVVLLAAAAGAAAGGFVMNGFGLRLGMQICLAVVALMWFVPLPDDPVSSGWSVDETASAP